MSDNLIHALIQAPLSVILVIFIYKVLQNQEKIIVKLLEILERITKIMKDDKSN